MTLSDVIKKLEQIEEIDRRTKRGRERWAALQRQHQVNQAPDKRSIPLKRTQSTGSDNSQVYDVVDFVPKKSKRQRAEERSKLDEEFENSENALMGAPNHKQGNQRHLAPHVSPKGGFVRGFRDPTESEQRVIRGKPNPNYDPKGEKKIESAMSYIFDEGGKKRIDKALKLLDIVSKNEHFKESLDRMIAKADKDRKNNNAKMLKRIAGKLMENQKKKKIDKVKKKVKKSATQRLLEGIMKKTGALPAKRNIGGVGVNENDLASETSNSFAGNATRTRTQGLSEDEIEDDKKLSTIANPTQKSDVEQGVYGNVAGRPTNGLSTDTKVDAPKDYEGQSHDGIRSEQFKYEDKKPKVDDDHKNKAGEFVYSEHVPYKTKSFGAVGVPLTQENTWGMKYATKEEVEAYLSKQNVLNKVEQPDESISFGDDYKGHTTVKRPSAEVGQSKLSDATSKKIDTVRARRSWGRGKQEEGKKPGAVTADTRFIADDGSVHTTEAARNSRNVMVGQMRGTDRAPKMYGDKED